uniref:Uncharacterized protein n=1 Tax=Panagrolaimus sp. ES5 TaxID=591445 RepID=A0AC34EZF8_9BILA
MIKNDESEECIELCQNEHKCSPIKYIPEDLNSNIVQEPDFELFEENVCGKKAQRLIVFDSKNPNYGYIYGYCEKDNIYVCKRCRDKKLKYVSAKMLQDENGQNFVELSKAEHVCEPLEYSAYIQASNRQIVMAPNFQVIKRKLNFKNHQKLVVFTNDEKSECFEYGWNEGRKYFLCYSCKKPHKAFVYAKLFKNDKNEECVELSPNQHKCTPIKFIPEDISPKIVKEPDFKLWENIFHKRKIQKLTIFDPNNKNFGYVYSYNAEKKNYICWPCKSEKRYVTAVVKQDENGQNYVELCKNEHACKLQKV